MSSITHFQVAPNLYESLSSIEYKSILKNVTKQLKVPIDFHNLLFSYYMATVNCLVTHILQNIFLKVEIVFILASHFSILIVK